VENLAEAIQTDLQHNRIESATHGLLELERHIQEVWEQLQERNGEGAAREVLRNMLALFGAQLAQRPLNRQVCLEPLVCPLLDLRAQMRAAKQWAVADAIRDCLAAAGIVLEDGPEGIRWHLTQT
jgi:cysteinyl-tRNA synthetase